VKATDDLQPSERSWLGELADAIVRFGLLMLVLLVTPLRWLSQRTRKDERP